ncbi:hypothetical protein E2C01_024509 [Portunus trituberculatus]|uniref:Uncharacterized protein n=1 Tax=Portunus trituberculatus TaxID=210409 RepID=A0A5B7ECW5_PORTR|nr:hypothetical protein [Portunus trituberculatus]
MRLCYPGVYVWSREPTERLEGWLAGWLGPRWSLPQLNQKQNPPTEAHFPLRFIFTEGHNYFPSSSFLSFFLPARPFPPLASLPFILVSSASGPPLVCASSPHISFAFTVDSPSDKNTKWSNSRKLLAMNLMTTSFLGRRDCNSQSLASSAARGEEENGRWNQHSSEPFF